MSQRYADPRPLVRSEANRKIKGLVEIPGIPIFGNLFGLGDTHALTCQKWAKEYGPVFQVRMGNKRIVIANSFKSVRELWITNQSALISRPMLYTFHSVVSTSQGFTIGTSPWDESCKQRRKAAATALNRPAVAQYMPIIDLESYSTIRDIAAQASSSPSHELNPKLLFQRFALNTSLTLNYGFRCEGGKNDALLHEIIECEAAISRFRSTSNNWQDYVPLLRYLPGTNKGSTPVQYRGRRDVYLNSMISDLKRKIKEGTDIPCITGNILKDPSAKLNESEIKSICLTMVSAGLDTIPANILQGIGYLSTPHGQLIQARLYDEITRVYPDGEAWTACLTEEKVGYVSAFVKEVLRFYTVIPMCLPRRSIKEITYEGMTIPAGTSFYMNAYAANYDATQFDDPYTFNPDRYLYVDGNKKDEGVGAVHYAYGAGSRMCAGSHLANREQYVAYVRLIAAFRILPALEKGDRAVTNAMDANSCKTALVSEVRDFKARFEVRDQARFDAWMEVSRLATDHLE